jgi:hypothetical protein
MQKARGQKGWNGVAILACRMPIPTRLELPGDAGDTQSSFLEAASLMIALGPKFSLAAMGLFSVVKPADDPSLFIYATLDAALGGPPFFYVTGLAAAFGFNRDILLPESEPKI